MRFKHIFQNNSLLYLMGYFGLFCVLFAKILIDHALPGSTDSIGHIAILHDHLTNVHNYFFDSDWGYAFYPEKGIGAYSESYLFHAIVFLLCQSLGMSDAASSWLLVVTLYALNAFAVYKLSYHYTNNTLAALVSGIAFSSSAFMIGNIELLNSIGFFPVPFSLLYLERYSRSKNGSELFISVVILGLTHLVSGYAFLFGVSCWAGLALIIRPSIGSRVFAISFIAFIVSVAPFGFRLAHLSSDGIYNPVVDIPDSMSRFSMSFKSLVSSLPNNLLYPHLSSPEGQDAVRIPYYANSGFVIAALFAIGIFVRTNRNRFYIVLVGISALISFGSELSIGSITIHLPLFYLKRIELVETFLRIPGRAFVVAQFGMAIVVGSSISNVLQKVRPSLHHGLIALVCIFIVLENVPFPFRGSSASEMLNTPKIYSGVPGSTVHNLAILPSTIFTGSGYNNGISEFSREYYYQLWQTKHHHNIINGSSSYFPVSRMRNNSLLRMANNPDSLMTLIRTNDLDYIIYHGKMTFNANEKAFLPSLMHHDSLVLVDSSDNDYLFKVKK